MRSTFVRDFKQTLSARVARDEPFEAELQQAAVELNDRGETELAAKIQALCKAASADASGG